MNNEGTTKASKDKNCPYCGQAFTSSSLGRHLDLYIKEKSPKVPDGIHNVDEIRKLRGSITRRQPRGRGRRDTSASAHTGSQNGSKRSHVDSDTDSVAKRSLDVHHGTDSVRMGNSQRVFNRQMMKSSLEVRQKVQDALDTARAAELALREVIGSWRAAKRQIDVDSMPFDFNPLSLDFPALCLQCLEPPPTLFSSTQHSISTSWSVTPPGHKQNEALSNYFRGKLRKWKTSCSATTTASTEEMLYTPSQAGTRQDQASHLVQKAEKAVERLEKQVAEHLSSAYNAWEQLSLQRQQELWVLEMARSVGKKQEQLNSAKAMQQSLRQEIANLKSQIDTINRNQQPKEFTMVPPMTLRLNEKMMELWDDTATSGGRSAGLNLEDPHSDLGTVVSGTIERWKSVVVSTRVAKSTQKQLDSSFAPLKTPTSATYPMTPDISLSIQQRQGFEHGQQRYPQSSPNAQLSIARNTSVSSADPTATTMSEAKTSATSTPARTHSDSDSEADADADADADEDMDADADAEMEMENDFLSSANTPAHHSIPQTAQHQGHQGHQMHTVQRLQDPHVPHLRHSSYTQRGGNYAAPSVLPSQQVHMSQQAFNHQMQSLTNHLNQEHGALGLGWDVHH